MHSRVSDKVAFKLLWQTIIKGLENKTFNLQLVDIRKFQEIYSIF